MLKDIFTDNHVKQYHPGVVKSFQVNLTGISFLEANCMIMTNQNACREQLIISISWNIVIFATKSNKKLKPMVTSIIKRVFPPLRFQEFK